MRWIRFVSPVAAEPVCGELVGNLVRADGAEYALSELRLLAPCAPSKIVCIGRNYRAHAEELGNVAPERPLLFFKPPGV